MINIIDFFKNLPKKKCHRCNDTMNEQADCYGNVCHKCDHPAR